MSKGSQDVKTLNAKKLDVNFDSDDFFNSFEPQKPANKFVAKLQEVKDPFDIAPEVSKLSTSIQTFTLKNEQRVDD